MDRYTFGEKTLNTQRPRVDRFVPPRSSLQQLRKPANATQHTGDIWFNKYLQRKKFTKHLDHVFGLEPGRCGNDLKDEYYVRPWPCIPRKTSYLSSADSILDLPTYSYAPFPELLDWSNDNILVAALGRSYHKWSWRSQSLISQGITQHNIQCCKFDPRGELLILGTEMKTVEIHDNANSKCLARGKCCCIKIDNEFCSITAVDWSPSGNSFVTGCSRGVISIFGRNGERITWRQPWNGDWETIILVRISPDARYVAAISLNGSTVLLMSWPDLELYLTLESDWTAKTIAWHPWRSALLGIGSVMTDLSAVIAFWETPTGKVREATIGREQYSLDAMLFSHRTGELVLSLWNLNRETVNIKSQLVVMSDPDTVVDKWGEGRTGTDRVRTMVFSPDGTKLATATSEEDLIIWNFLPEDKKKHHVVKRHSAFPVFMDIATDGFSIR